MVDDATILRKFTDEDLQLTRDAFEMLRARADAEAVIDKVLENIRAMIKKPFIITGDEITKILSGAVSQPQTSEIPEQSSLAIREEKPELEAQPKALSELVHLRFRPLAAEFEARVDVLQDITGQSYTKGEIKDFVKLFKDRYQRLYNILRKRMDLQGAVPIKSVFGYGDGETVKIIGMVADKRESKIGNIIIELEDESGRVAVIIPKWRRDIAQKAGEVVQDEVIGVVATIRKTGDSTPQLSATDVIWPETPVQREPAHAPEPVCAALISDLHVGSEMFLEDAFTRFLKWLRGEVGNEEQRELAGRVKYLVIAGDVVDGVGVYPRQKEELLIRDIFKQYDAAAELLAQVPDHVKIIIAPGNHDAVRQLEPQPAISKEVAPALYDLDALMVGNPSWLKIHGVKFLVYHGRSFDDLIATIPGLDHQKPVPPMIKLIQKRHLAPIYGGHTSLSPENRDYMVIEDIPDVMHCGHMHVYGCDRYRNIMLVNSGTFQERTIYMTGLGVKPTPGIVPVVDLQTHQAKVIHFV
jgi:DNA polymerase II small subunit